MARVSLRRHELGNNELKGYHQFQFRTTELEFIFSRRSLLVVRDAMPDGEDAPLPYVSSSGMDPGHFHDSLVLLACGGTKGAISEMFLAILVERVKRQFPR